MLETLLRGYLVYLSFIQPVVYGAQLCRSTSPDPVQVTNVTLTLIFAWLLEVADVVFLSSFIAMRWLYLAARIVLALYFAHPRFLGAVRIYRKLFASLVDTYSPVIDSVVMRHVQTIGDSGLMQYGAVLSTGLLRGMAAVAGIAKTLMEASVTTNVPAAALPRRMSQARDDRLTENEPSEQYASAPLRASPPPVSAAMQSTRYRPVQPPSLYDDEDEDEGTEEYSTSPPPAVQLVAQEVRVFNADAWSSADESSEPPLGRGVPNRPYREPETMVNRARARQPFSSPFDD